MKSLSKLFCVSLFLLTASISTAQTEKQAILEVVNPVMSLPAPGADMKIEYKGFNLLPDSKIFLAIVLDNELTLLKPNNTENGMYTFFFPAPYITLRYFALHKSADKFIQQTETRYLDRGCLPSVAGTENSDSPYVQTKAAEAEIAALENAQKYLRQIKSVFNRETTNVAK